MKPETHWFITGRCGLYYGSNHRTRREAIHYHCACLGNTWEECRDNGDRAIRLTISEPEATNGQE